MNEPEQTAATADVLIRVGRVLGAREGTKPDHMPWLRAQRREVRAEVRAGTLRTVASGILAARGMPALALPLDARDLSGLSDEEVVDALLHCEDEPDLHARLRALRDRPGWHPAPRT